MQNSAGPDYRSAGCGETSEQERPGGRPERARRPCGRASAHDHLNATDLAQHGSPGKVVPRIMVSGGWPEDRCGCGNELMLTAGWEGRGGQPDPPLRFFTPTAQINIQPLKELQRGPRGTRSSCGARTGRRPRDARPDIPTHRCTRPPPKHTVRARRWSHWISHMAS